MTAELITLGISHKTASVELRERLALTQSAVTGFLHEVAAHPEVHEAVVISTCNRTELTLVVGDAVSAESAVLGVLAQRAHVRPTELAERMYSPRNCDAARQLFRVCAGLESMIVGEAEIQGQVKRAYEIALAAGTTGPLTNRLFTAALLTGKRARSETTIGQGRASISSTAVEVAHDVLAGKPDPRVIIIGAGATSELTARALADSGVWTIFVANRHADRARSLADRFGGEVVALDDLPEQLAGADVVVASTASPHPIVGVEELELVMRARQGRPLLLVDIAVPRDIDPACADLPGVTLYDMDDLQRAVTRNLDVRQAEAARARTLVEQENERFERWLSSLDVVPTIAALRARGESIVEQVLRENESRWQSLSEADRERLAVMARAVIGRMLHEPTMRLKGSTGEDAAYVQVHALRELFGLDDGAPTLEGERPPAAEVTQLESRRRRQG
ncbi:MAG TPA: glutamyl-tRNA reductase [Solirubrobacteraceae bacterium]|nr:glutamyl-tRNA reductase [Solirubrobacteraceae bacterium]